MKLTLSILVSVLLLAGCESKQHQYLKGSNNMAFDVFEIDSCEYIYIPVLGDRMQNFTHKGNCKYCEKRRKEDTR